MANPPPILTRCLWALAAVIPIALVIGSIACEPKAMFPGLALFVAGCALFVGMSNFWNLIREPLWELRGKDAKDYRHASGAPLIGTALATVACVIGFGTDWVGTLCLATLILDVQGLPWYAGLTWWKDWSFLQSEYISFQDERGTK